MPPRDSQPQYASEPLYGPAGGPMSHVPLHGPVSHPDGPRDYPYAHVPHLNHFSPHPPAEQSPVPSGSRPATEDKNPSSQDYVYGEPYNRGPESQPPSPGHESGSSQGGAGANHYPSSSGVPRLPPILQVEKQQVTTSATQLASASRRRNEAHFVILGHIRKKGHTFASGLAAKRALHDNMIANRRRHQALHTAKSQNNVCRGCKKAFSRLDALNRHLRSDGGAECRALNLKAGSSRETFRSIPNSVAPDQDAARFFSSNVSPTQLPAGTAYDLSALRAALPQPQTHVHNPQLQQPAPAVNWASDFAIQQPLHSQTWSEIMKGKEVQVLSDVVIPNSGLQQMSSSLSHGPMQWNPIANVGLSPLNFSPAPLGNIHRPVEPSQISWDKEFSSQETAISQSATLQEQPQSAEQIARQIPQDGDDLARTAGQLLENVRNEQNPKFQNSQFMDLMRKLRDRDIIVEGNQMVENEGQQVVDVKGKGRAIDNKSWHTSQMSTSAPPVGQISGKPHVSFADAARHQLAQPESKAVEDLNDAYFRQENAEYQQYWNEARTGNTSQVPTVNADVASWERMQHDWDQFEATATGIKRVDNYQFQDHNPYLLGDSSTRHHMMHSGYQSLSESVLQLEAAVQRDMSDAMAWFDLGVKQQENEREQKAFQALHRALELDPSHLPTWLALGVSNTNESNRIGTYDAINEWVTRNERYAAAVQEFRAQNPLEAEAPLALRYTHLINTLIVMARSDTNGTVDAETQIELAILLNTNEEYQKAQDCFLSALAVRPDDWLLYNRVGATMANSGRAEDALQYYYKALELNPGYIRARHRYEEAAQHILDALVLQDNDGIRDAAGLNEKRGVMSTALWDSLKTTCMHMQRIDLATLCDRRDLEAFRLNFHM
ncbi:hypothetical protein DXG01_005074 [Tephrocybe rancida]|nr:hypothetical protein DXG01_005074 [Tephrocybe rancida]